MKNLFKFLIIILLFSKTIFAGQIFSSPTDNYMQVEEAQFKIEKELSLADIYNNFKNNIFAQGMAYTVPYYHLKINNHNLYYVAKQEANGIFIFVGDTLEKNNIYCQFIYKRYLHVKDKEKSNNNSIEEQESHKNYNGKQEVK